MATGGRLALPKPLQHEGLRFWFKCFEVCAANGWDNAKKLLCLPTLKGRAWAIYDTLGEGDTDTYDHLKDALFQRLSSDTEEDCLAAR